MQKLYYGQNSRLVGPQRIFKENFIEVYLFFLIAKYFSIWF